MRKESFQKTHHILFKIILKFTSFVTKMDPMIASATADLSQSQRDDLRTYIREHPEIRTILQDFMANLLMDKPEDTKAFAREYFGNFQQDVPESQTE